ncbi:MAG TPA: adenylate/guanylate cyclase domain-containing protein [Gaiellaceae bacterium]|nr:adenylate/guanylate cyclase domain-containing protein [Gaiellaceae bacterium]
MTMCPKCGKELAGGAFRFCPYCGASLDTRHAPQEARKTVTVLFCDVTGSTRLGETLDPETLRSLLARYFDRMKTIVEKHGGSVEKFIGDAVMAVFGIPVVHEDDALRAVRAAAEMRDAFAGLGVSGRIGVTTGEMVTGSEERLATGDAVNVAARLEQTAQPGEVVVGAPTLALVRDAVEVEELPPLSLKGKRAPVAAYRLLGVAAEAPRRHEGRMVGREREKRLLADAWERVRAERSCHLFTILGPAGVGKSRLCTEFVAGATDAHVVQGSCLSYGEGITYWPVVEVLKQLPERTVERPVEAAIRALLGEEEHTTSSEEIAWAFRKTLETAAAAQPLLCVFDDLHWGEETFLDLVEHVADLSRDAPILLLCMGRPDLLDRRPAWGGGKVNSTMVLLEPLADDETELLIESLADLEEPVRARIREASEGNPLFVEEMVAMLRESSGGDLPVPPTIRALLAARLDQLEPQERDVLQLGAIEGRVFHRGAVQELSSDAAQVPARLTALVRKELVRPDKPQLPREDAFRFRHLLIRDAAYDALPKAMRAELHARFADWLAERGADVVELDELLGYHLEQASRYRDELGLERDDELRAAARRRLADAGRRALMRQDFAAARNLLERALGLVAPGATDYALELDLVDAVHGACGPQRASEAAAAAAARTAACGDALGACCLRLEGSLLRLYVDREASLQQVETLAEEALAACADSGDHVALYRVHLSRCRLAQFRLRYDEQLKAAEQAAFHATRSHLPHLRAESFRWLAGPRFYGSTSISELLRWLDDQESVLPTATEKTYRSLALAFVGRFDEARALCAELRHDYAERGALARLGGVTSQNAVTIELLAGDPASAARLGEEGCAILEEAGELGLLSTSACFVARALYQIGRLDEAETWADRAAELGSGDDAATQMLWRQVKAKVFARRGDAADAERLAREAVALAEETDKTDWCATAYADLAEVLELTGRYEQAAAALERALVLYERKGNLVLAERTRFRLQDLESRRASAPS